MLIAGVRDARSAGARARRRRITPGEEGPRRWRMRRCTGFGRTFLAPFLGAALGAPFLKMATVSVERTARVARAGVATTGVPTREVMANIVSRV